MSGYGDAGVLCIHNIIVSCIDERGGYKTAYDVILYVLNRPFKKEEDSSCGNVKKRDVAQNTGAAFQEPGRLLEIKQGRKIS